jgi:hypothetical protein
MEAKGHVTVKIETFNSNGERTNVECFSVLKDTFLNNWTSPEWKLNLKHVIENTRREIVNPTPKTDMP